MIKKPIVLGVTPEQRPDSRPQDNWSGFQQSIIDNANFLMKSSGATHLYRTDARLVDIYLENLPEDKQHYNCNACKLFLSRYGNLAVMWSDGSLIPLFWNKLTADKFPYFTKSVNAMHDAVKKAKVTGVFTFNENDLYDTTVFGIPENVSGSTGYVWSHFYWPVHANLKRNLLHRSKYVERYEMLTRVAGEMTIGTIDTALSLIASGVVYRGSEEITILNQLKEMLTKINKIKRGKSNMLWTLVFENEAVYHIRGTAVYSFLIDLKTLNDVDKAIENFGYKKDPANYGRVKSEVSTTQINLAKKGLADLGLTNALKRRFAVSEELPLNALLWKNGVNAKLYTPKKAVEDDGFSNIKPKSSVKQVTESGTTEIATKMTWMKFKNTMLNYVNDIEVVFDNPNRLIGITTEVLPKSGKLFTWDNPFAWYYNGGHADGEMQRRVEAAGGQYKDVNIRCSLMWGGKENWDSRHTDLDLHCILKQGRFMEQHLFYSNKRVGGGYLDVDANGGGPTSNEPVENIRWEKSKLTPPDGLYSFYVHNFKERGFGITPYTIELEVGGKIYTINDTAGHTGWQNTHFSFEYKDGKVTGNGISARSSSLGSTGVRQQTTWGLVNGQSVRVKSILKSPNGDAGKQSHVFFLLEGCKDDTGKAMGFLPEYLNESVRPYRKVLEHYAKNNPVEGLEEGNAFGVGYNQDTEWNLTLKVKNLAGITQTILIDRFD